MTLPFSPKDQGKALWQAVFTTGPGKGRIQAVDNFNGWMVREGAKFLRGEVELHFEERGGNLYLVHGDKKFGKGDWDDFVASFSAS